MKNTKVYLLVVTDKEVEECKKIKISLGREKLKELIFADYGCSVDKLEISEDENGKPYFENMKNMKFNISDSINVIGIIINNEGKNVGIDVEHKRNINTRMIERWFHVNEIATIDETVDYRIEFTRIWTRKEAYVKEVGTGLKMDTRKIDTYSEEIDKMLLTRKITCQGVEGYFTVAVEGGAAEENIEWHIDDRVSVIR